MSLDRRSVLRGLAAVGFAMTQQGLVQNEVTRMRGLDSTLFGRLSTLVHAGRPATLVGLADDASAALILDLVRSAGGRVLCNEHHRIADGLSAPQVAAALGRFNGEWAIEEFTRAQWVTLQSKPRPYPF